MEKIGLNEIREGFLKFFESKAHLVIPSYSLVPRNDKSLLLINAGMAPLKSYFTGLETPPNRRMATCQKCIRTGDIDRVGRTSRHATFFEMLGNFSFGDYFKSEVIPWAWEFVTEVLKMPKDRLYVTIYLDDDEAYEIWSSKTDIDPVRIFRLGKEDNFWEHGQGPCGPCSEIHFLRYGEEIKSLEEFITASDEDRVIEFWNLVFTQFDKDENGNYNRLQNPNIDTGMGLERVSALVQGVDSIFEIDTMKNILNSVCTSAGKVYGKSAKDDISLRIITDHIRSVVFMVSDGILPSNEGRGYVLRRLLRRAARHGRLLGIQGLFLHELCDIVIKNSQNAYPVLDEKQEYIKKIIKLEEERFGETIDQGMGILNQYIDDLKMCNKKVLSGEKAFKLYDTYGFPIELTSEILGEYGFELDMEGFNSEMQEQRRRARAARGETNYMGRELDIYSTIDPGIQTLFSGYDRTSSSGKISLIIRDGDIVESASEGDDVAVILDNTTFYAEMGGQVGDTGIISGKGFKIEITDCRKTPNNKVIHIGRILEGTISIGDNAACDIDTVRRMGISRNHTATHLLHSALKQVLGSHVEQAGSLVTPDRLRFDFSHFEAVKPEELSRVEEIVNEKILDSMDVNTVETCIDEARRMGATALFGEKYGDSVRVVKAGDFSMELCGGTHVKNTSSIGMFKIISESGVAAGVRRIEGVTGKGALSYVDGIESIIKELSASLKAPARELPKKIESLSTELKEKEKEIEKLNSKMALSTAEDIINNARDIKGVKVVSSIANLDAEGLRNLGDRLRDKLGKSVIVLSSNLNGKIIFMAASSSEAIKCGAHAGNIVKEVASIAGGGGGGKPEMAQAGGKFPDKIDDALKSVYDIVEKMIK